MRKSLFYFLCIVATLVGIFMFSAQDSKDTAKTSDTIVKPIENRIKTKSDKTFKTEKAEKDYWKKINHKVDKFVRKTAHGIIYGVLGFFTIMFLRSIGVPMGDAIVLTMMLCGGYGACDELHQKGVEGRTCRFSDVCIDMFGAWVTTTCVYVADKIVGYNRKKPEP